MNRFEEELLGYINDIFQGEINQNIVEVKTNNELHDFVVQETDSGEFAMKPAKSSENWMVAIVRTTTELKHVRIVIKSPDMDVMNQIDDYRLVLRTMVERAKDILNNPPFEQYVNQGVIKSADGEGYVEFIPRDKLRECGKSETHKI
jgi:hypothetical protein